MGQVTIGRRVKNRHRNPISVRRKRQRLPSSLLIENASARVLVFATTLSAEAFPIKASDPSDGTAESTCASSDCPVGRLAIQAAVPICDQTRFIAKLLKSTYIIFSI